jgi:thiosulfate dehydrogenase (quinone) large subunit
MSDTNVDQPVLDRQMGFAILRIMVGVNMLTRSIVRIPDIQNFVNGVVSNFSDTFLPDPFVLIFGYTIVLVETITGVLLLLGWKTRWALAAVGVLLCCLAFGMILQQNFGTAANIMIYGIAIFLLLFHTKYDAFGVDRGFPKSGNTPG